MSQKKQRNNTFFGGAAILAVGIVLVKVISMFYKLPPGQHPGQQRLCRLHRRLQRL